MTLEAGTRLGVYEIGDALGAGGMGEVYRARDTKLGRSVAIKVLPDSVAHDAERIARFQREARALAALNHPHIAALFGMEEADGRHFLVMELVEGETLEERLLASISIGEALQIARQIADALEAAHEKGIIHRDLKPANVKVTPDDKVKILDFGLAKAMEGAGEAPGRTELVTHTEMGTEAGVILGTAAYMSPEQARAKPVDRRADIWAFGCVLYEMLTGKQAFAPGGSISDAIAAILTGDVDWSAVPANTPPRIRDLLRRCLQKDPQKRLPHIGLARFEIDDASLEPTTVPEVALLTRRPPTRWKRAAVAIVAAGVIGALSAVAAWMLKPQSPPVVTRFSFVLPDGQAFTNTGRQAIAISPDGTHIVYVANERLFVRAVWDQEPRAIAGTENDRGVFQPVFSPDGRSLAFVGGTEVRRIALTGGTAATIATVSGGVYGMTWTGDHLVFGDGGSRILRVPVAGGTPEVLLSVPKPEAVSSPSILPGGNHLLFSHATLTDPAVRWTKSQVVVLSLATGQRTTIVDAGTDGRYLSNGYLAYAVGGVVYRVPFDVDRLAIRGTPAPMIEGLRRGGPTGAAQFAVATTTGSLAYLPGTPSSPSESELFRTDPKGNAVRLNVRGGQYEQPRLSPDGTHVAFGSVDPRVASVWVYELSGTSAMRRLTSDGNNRYPVWAADGTRVIFQSDREGHLGLFWHRADGTGASERLTRPGQGTAHLPHSSSPDGRHLLYTALNGTTATLWLYSMQDRKTVQVADVTSSGPLGATFSPDGRFIAYFADDGVENRGSRVFVMPFPLNRTRYDLGGGTHPMWSADGRQLFMPRTPGRMGVITISTYPTFTFSDSVATEVRAMGATGAQAPRAFDVGRDGTIVGIITAGNLEALSANREIRVVLNWFEELRRQQP